jgi:hypothetical protein
VLQDRDRDVCDAAGLIVRQRPTDIIGVCGGKLRQCSDRGRVFSITDPL